MSSRHWMPLYVADYLADTAHLRALQSGAYLHLIMHYWRSGCLPTDEKQLASIARMTDGEWAENRELLQSFFHSGWQHKRIDEELAEAEAKYALRAEAGRLGGLTRAHGPSNAIAMLQQNSSNALAKSNQPQPQPHVSKILTCENGEKVRGHSGKPKHGATGRGFTYIWADREEWAAFAADYQAYRGYPPKPDRNGGKWFKTLGEANEQTR